MEDEVAESKNLEYKEELDLKSDHKRTLLKTASAFANTNGGLLIYGIKAKDGIPTELTGVTIDNEDKMGMQIEDTIRNNSEPRIPSIEIEFIEKSGTDKYFILIKIQRSWNLPHRVKLGGKAGKFYLRRDRKNDEMDIFELRTTFNLSETLADKIKGFREERISGILSDETPMPLKKGAKIVLQLIPINAFYPGQKYDIEKINQGSDIELRAMYAYSPTLRYNFDGFLASESPDENGFAATYVQLYRNGIIEATMGDFFDNNIKMMSNGPYEIEVVNSLTQYLEIYKELNVEFPIFVFITIMGVKGYQMELDDRRIPFLRSNHFNDRDILANPEILLKKYPENVGNVLKPAFDAIRNAFGFVGSRNYNEKGEWNPRR